MKSREQRTIADSEANMAGPRQRTPVFTVESRSVRAQTTARSQ